MAFPQLQRVISAGGILWKRLVKVNQFSKIFGAARKSSLTYKPLAGFICQIC